MSKFDWSSAKKFGKKVADSIQEAADTVTKKTEEAVNTQKVKAEISKLGRTNEKDFAEMGRLVYEIYKKGEMEDADLRAISEEIEKREILIAEKEEALKMAQKKKTCTGCGAAVDEDAQFCPECGSKLEAKEPVADADGDDNLYEEVSESEEESVAEILEDGPVMTEEASILEDGPVIEEEASILEEDIPEEV